MSSKLCRLVWECCNTKLSSTEKAVLVRMADFASDDGTDIFPSLNRLQRNLGFYKDTIARVIKSLEKKSVIRKIKLYDKNTNKAASYEINVDALLELHPKKDVVNGFVSSDPESIPSVLGTELVPSQERSGSDRGTEGVPIEERNRSCDGGVPFLERRGFRSCDGGVPFQERTYNNQYNKHILNNNINIYYYINNENPIYENKLHEYFEEFWTNHVRPVSKVKSKEVFFQKCKDGKLDPQILITAAKLHRQQRELRQQLGLMVSELEKGSVRWLEEELWDDVVKTEEQIRMDAKAKWDSKRTPKEIQSLKNNEFTRKMEEDSRARRHENERVATTLLVETDNATDEEINAKFEECYDD